MPTPQTAEQRDYQRERGLFLIAVELKTPAERNDLLDRECAGDPALRRRIESLLAAHAADGSLPAGGAALTETRPIEAVPSKLIAGRYKLLEEIGTGGMGVVWMAEQRSPVRRLVALKLIKPGMDSHAVIARFEAERQALALMDHPNIARVFDGGMTEEDRPYFVMELVRGLPVTQYCDERRMTVRDRLLLFIEVCQAVQHAHQKGIIHRDLKPTNVLVTEHDGKPVPKVIDFGLAKAMGGAGVLTEHTLHTAYGAMAGTPLYSAPEQVAINALDVDTRADIYALGVLLYEILAGSPPLTQERLKQAAWDEIRRVIREEEPQRPSMRISTSAMLPSLAATRHVEPAKLSGQIKGDLDWIVLKALEKERSRRYDSATAFAADIERHLKDEPVVAVPPTVRYRLRKFATRYKAALTTAAVIVALLAGGVLVSSWLFVRARKAERTVSSQLTLVQKEEREASRQRDEAVKANRRAVAEVIKSNDLIAEYYAGKGILAERDNDYGLALLFFSKALQSDIANPERAAVQRQRFSLAYRRMPQPVDVTAADVPGQIVNGRFVEDVHGQVRISDSRTHETIKDLFLSKYWADVEFDHDGKYVIASCSDKKVRIWESVSGRLCADIPFGQNNRENSASDVSFTPDGKYAVTVDEQLCVREIKGGKRIFPALPSGHYRFTDDSQHVAIGNKADGVRIFDVKTGRPVIPALQPAPQSDCFCWTPDGKHIAGWGIGNDSDRSGRLAVWDAFTGKLEWQTPNPETSSETQFDRAFFSPDSKTIWMREQGGYWTAWDLASKRLLIKSVVKNDQQTFASPVFSPDASLIAFPNLEGVYVCSTATGKAVSGRINRFGCRGLAFSSDGRRLTVVDQDRDVSTWDVGSASPIGPVFNQDVKADAFAAFSLDGRTVVTADNARSWSQPENTGFRCRLWDSRTGEPITPPVRSRHDVLPTRDQFTRDGRWLSPEGMFVDCAKGEVDTIGIDRAKPFSPLAISEDGKLLLIETENTLQLWNVANGNASVVAFAGAPRTTSSGKASKTITGAEFSPDSSQLAVNYSTGDLWLWETKSGLAISLHNNSEYKPKGWRRETVAFSPDGRYLAATKAALFVETWNIATGALLTVSDDLATSFVGEPLSHNLGISPDSKRIMFATDPVSIWTLDPMNRTTVALEPSKLLTNGTSFSPDGKFIVVAQPGGVSIWDSATGHCVASRLASEESSNADGDCNTCAQFSPDGKRLLVGSTASTVLLDFSPLTESVETLEKLAEFMSDTELVVNDTERWLTSDGEQAKIRRREELVKAAPELFREISVPDFKGFPHRYQAYVESRVALAKTQEDRRELAMSFARFCNDELQASLNPEALILGEAAVKLDPTNLLAYDNLAMAYLWNERYTDALAIYRKYLGVHYKVDKDDVIFGTWAIQNIDALHDNGIKDPTLDVIAKLVGPTTRPATTQPATTRSSQ